MARKASTKVIYPPLINIILNNARRYELMIDIKMHTKNVSKFYHVCNICIKDCINTQVFCSIFINLHNSLIFFYVQQKNVNDQNMTRKCLIKRKCLRLLKNKQSD